MTKLVKRLDIVSTATAYSMEISAEKTMLMKNNEIEIKVLKLKTITRLSYLCSVITVEGGKPEMLSTIAQETAALLRCKPVWNDRSIFHSPKIRLKHSLLTSIFLYKPWNEVYVFDGLGPCSLVGSQLTNRLLQVGNLVSNWFQPC